MIGPLQWQQIGELFHAARERPVGDRSAFIAAGCGGDEEIRREVDALLALQSAAVDFLEHPALGPGSGADSRLAGWAHLAPGCRLGAFEILSVAGLGGMGEVYKARDTRLDRIVALKVLRGKAIADSEARLRLEREARSISRLNHPHICTLYDFGSASPGEGEPEVPFLVMEFLDGETLAERLRRVPLSLDETLRHGIALTGALTVAHAQGIVHRDLKPANIVLVDAGPDGDGRSEAKLLDFGVARFQQTILTADLGLPVDDGAELPTRGAIAGTLRYMSPEQVRGEEADPRSDIFALGSVLYEMVSGRSPFTGDTSESLMAAILSPEPAGPLPIQSRSGTAAAIAWQRLETVIMRCLEKVPDQRFSRMLDVKEALQGVARFEGSAQVTGERRSRWRPILAGVGVAGGVFLAAWLLPRARLTQPSEPPPMKVVQLTALNGRELDPTISPDGRQVAFSWNGEKEDNFDIYVKTIGSSEVRRLTTDPLADTLPVWSPDGTQIAFVREHPDSGGTVHSVLVTGGGERRLTSFFVGTGISARIAWSPDGRGIVARPDLTEDVNKQGNWSFYLIPFDGGAPRRLTTAKAPDLDVAPAFSPDGRRLAYAACPSLIRRVCDLNIVDLRSDYSPAGTPRQVAKVGMMIMTVAWSRDGLSLIYDTNGRGRWEVWRVGLDSRHEPERLEIAGDHSRAPAISAGVDQLVFERNSPVRSVYRLRPNHEPEPVLVSSGWDHQPSFSPDGSQIVFTSRRAGDIDEIWIASADGSNASQLTHGPGVRQGWPSWSPDGQSIAFESSTTDGHTDIWVIGAGGGVPRRVTTDPGQNSSPTWSRDSRRIYFLSSRSGGDIWGSHDTWQDRPKVDRPSE
jgi:eukaryotic-like serine/threonine-protein kinase